MPQNIFRKDRIDTGREEDKRKLTTLIDGRISEQIENVPSLTAPVIYGYAGVSLIPVFQKARNSQRITTGISIEKYQGNDSSGVNRAIFGNWFAYSQSGTQELLVRQYILCAGGIRNPLSIFINSESIRLDGWASFSSSTKNKWRNSAHHWNITSLSGDAAIAATKLAQVYLPNDREATDTAEGLTLVTGLYERRTNFDDALPEVFAIVMGKWPAKRIDSSGDIETYTDATAQRFSLHAALIDWIVSDEYGPELPSSDFDINSWRRTTRGGIALTQNAASIPLTIRIRAPAYDADTATTKNEYTTIGSPLPLLAQWPIWGTLDTSKTLSEVLQAFTRSCPPLLLWWSLEGKLKADVTNLIDLSAPDADAIIDENDIIGELSIDVPNDSYAHENVKVRFKDYEEDFKESVYDINTVLSSIEYATSGIHSYVVPGGVTKINVTTVGGNGGQGGATAKSYLGGVYRTGGDGGTGHTEGTDGGEGGRAFNSSRFALPGMGAENRTGTGIVGNEIPNGGTVVNEDVRHGFSGGRYKRTTPTNGFITDILDDLLTESQIIARRGTGGGGGGGWLYWRRSEFDGSIDINSSSGGGGGGGGGSSAILRGNILLVEGQGGRGFGGKGGNNSNIAHHVKEVEGENGFDNSSILNVTPGEILTVIVGQGGRGGNGAKNGKNGIDGRVNIASIQDDEDTSGPQHSTIVVADLCGSKQHARKISQEVALRSQFHRVSGRLTRKYLGVEPGDILKSIASPMNLSILLIDRSIKPDLSVEIIGLRLPTIAQDPSIAQDPFVLSDSNDTGLDVETKALLIASGPGTTGNDLYADSDRGGTDVVIDGELGVGADDTVISRIRRASETTLVINDDDDPVALNIGAYFDTGGDGNDLTLYLQTSNDGEVSFAVASSGLVTGAGFIRFTLSNAVQDLLNNIKVGDRFIFKLARAI